MGWQTLWGIVASLALMQDSRAEQWNCDVEKEPAPAISNATAHNIDWAFKTNSYEEILAELKKMLPRAKGESKVAIYEAQAFAYRTLKRMDQVAASYKAVYDLESASMRARLRARDNLAAALIDLGRAKEIIVLYTDAARPVCGALSAEAAYALSLAYNAIGDDKRARATFDAAWPIAEERFKGDSYLWNPWLLLKLRLDCAQRIWRQCAADLEHFGSMELPEFPPLAALNRFVVYLRKVPELADTFASLERKGVVGRRGFIASKWSFDSQLSVISCPTPKYPKDAAMRNISGTVSLEFVIDGSGVIKSIDVVESTPPDVFEVVTLESAWGCKFSANIINGMPVTSIAHRTYNFGDKR